MLSGRNIDAAEAHRFGIVCEVVPTDDLDSRTAELAGQLARIDQPVARALRRCLRAANDLPLGDGLFVERRSARLVAAGSIGDTQTP